MSKQFNYRQHYAKLNRAKENILKCNPTVRELSGIYALTRTDENGFKHAYVGQAVNVLERLASHLIGYEQHIDRSLKTHKLYNDPHTPYGWNVECFYFDTSLDQREREYIKLYHENGYQLHNKTLGGQDSGKVDIAERKPTKTYRDGLKQGYKNAVREISKLFEQNLQFTHQGNLTKRKENAIIKLETIFKENK